MHRENSRQNRPLAILTVAIGLAFVSGFADPSRAQVSSIRNGDGSLTIAPTTKAAVASLNAGHANKWSADQFFGSVRPWCDVRAHGAVGNGSTDDSAAFASCIKVLASTGGIIFVPPGVYCVFSGVALTGTAGSILLRGAGQDATVINVCGHNVVAVKVDGSGDILSDMAINGYNSPSAVGQAVWFTQNCVNCTGERLFINFGHYSLEADAPDVELHAVQAGYAYGAANVYIRAGIWIYNGKFDQGWPVSMLTSEPATWSSATAYAAGAAVAVGGFILQATAAGTSGSTMPTAAPYGVNITDGTVTWQLYAPTSYIGLDYDTTFIADSNNEGHCFKCDVTGPWSIGVSMTNRLGGTAPALVKMSGLVTAGRDVGVDLSAGSGFFLTQSEISGFNTGILTQSNWQGDVTLESNIVWDLPNAGIYVGAGRGFHAGGNLIRGNGIGLRVGSNINQVNFVGNDLSATPFGGANTTCIQIDQGSGNYLVVTGNTCGGATVTNAATGANNYLPSGSNP
jgi:hypothetical protein